MLLDRGLLGSEESLRSKSMVAMESGDVAIVALSLEGEAGAVKEFSEDCPQRRNLEKSNKIKFYQKYKYYCEQYC